VNKYKVELVTFQNVIANNEEEAYEKARQITSVDELVGFFEIEIELLGEKDSVTITRGDKICDKCVGYDEFSNVYCPIYEQIQDYAEFDETQETTGCSKFCKAKLIRNLLG